MPPSPVLVKADSRGGAVKHPGVVLYSSSSFYCKLDKAGLIIYARIFRSPKSIKG